MTTLHLYKEKFAFKEHKPSGTMIEALTTGSWTSITLEVVSELSGKSVGLLIIAILSRYTTCNRGHLIDNWYHDNKREPTFVRDGWSCDYDLGVIFIFESLPKNIHMQST